MSKIILEAKNLYKSFGNFQAVNNINLKVEEGEILGLLGPNGAGKTTTIQMLLGVLKPTSGEVHYFGQEFWQNRSQILEHVNFSSTYVNLPWDLTVKEILTYVSYLYDLDDRKKRVAEVIEKFKLKDILNQPVKDLSAGQETRTNLAKAFINDPKILLLDEPTASLDPDIADYIRKFLVNEREEKKLSILITSHNMNEVTEICDRVVFIDHGTVIADGTPQNLARSVKDTIVELRYDSKFDEVSKFLNEKNYKFRREENLFEIEVGELEIPKLLEDLIENNLKYIEIEINKPNLEDYFLHLTRDRNVA